ncbi:MAG: hypothetical protein HYX68_27275 [Planctomycetes bacterium]|nr:hypothetical protein [Planctomycetota bacterium]
MRNRIPNCLAMLDIDKQKLRRGGINAAYCQVANAAVLDAACRLLPKVITQFLDRAIEQGTLPGLDSVNPKLLCEKFHAQLSAIPALSDPGLVQEDQDNRLGTFLGLRAGVTTDLAREIVAKAGAVVGDPMNRLREAMQAAYAAAPGAVRDIASSLRTDLDRLRLPEPNWKSLIRWQELKCVADKIRQRRGILPSSTIRTLQEALTGETRRLYDQVLRALATEKIVAAWLTAKAELSEFLDTIAKRAAEVTHALANIKTSLDHIRNAVAADQRTSRASVVKHVPGPTEDQVIAGMLGQVHVTDEAALARALLDQFESRLREICPQVCAWIKKDECLPELLRGIPPETHAAEFRTIVEQAQGAGQSFYELLEKDGIDECVDFLFRRSEPTIHLSGRDMARFGVSPTRLTIITLPQPVGPKDYQIRDKVRAAFEKIEPNCAFSDAPVSDRTITVVRLVVGWPIGIEGQNHNLLENYRRCHDFGHRPHLFYIVPESTDGKIVEGYKSLDSITTYPEKEENHAEKNHA